MILNDNNYYSKEANLEYMSVSQFKDFVGTYGRRGCEYAAMEKLFGRWNPPPTTPLLVGSYVDSYVEGSLDSFIERNPEIFTSTGELKAPFRKAEEIM